MDEVVEQPADIVDQFKQYLNPQPPAEPEKEVTQPETDATAEPEEPKAETDTQEQPVVEIDPDAEAFEVTVKVEGGNDEVKKVSLTELQKGYMMQADYVRKTKELAKQRETLSSEIEAKVKPAVEHYENNLKVIAQYAINLAGQELQNIDWSALSRDDPARFVELTQRNNQIKYLYDTAVEQVNKQEQARQEKIQQEERDKAQACVEELKRDIPGWDMKMYDSQQQVGMEYGFTKQEMERLVDARMFKVLWDAQKWRDIQKSKPIVERKIAAVPKVMKPGTAEKSDETVQKLKELAKQQRKSGSVDDTAAMFLHRLRAGK
jgi:hypothetical protein